VSTELGERDPYGHRILLWDGQARLLYRRGTHCARGHLLTQAVLDLVRPGLLLEPADE